MKFSWKWCQPKEWVEPKANRSKGQEINISVKWSENRIKNNFPFYLFLSFFLSLQLTLEKWQFPMFYIHLKWHKSFLFYCCLGTMRFFFLVFVLLWWHRFRFGSRFFSFSPFVKLMNLNLSLQLNFRYTFWELKTLNWNWMLWNRVLQNVPI